MKNLVRLDLGRKPGVALRLREIVLREPNAEELRSQGERQAEREAKLAQEKRVNDYYDLPFENDLVVTLSSTGETLVKGAAGTVLVRSFESAHGWPLM